MGGRLDGGHAWLRDWYWVVMCFYYTLDRGVYEIAHGRYVEMDGQARVVREFYQLLSMHGKPLRVAFTPTLTRLVRAPPAS
jgi:hypothetical protein